MWLLGDAFQPSLKDFEGAVRVLGAPEARSVRRVRGGAAPDHHGHLTPRSQWSCLVLRIVLQDALSGVMKVYPPLKPKGFVDDTTAFVGGQDKDLPGIAEKVLKSTRLEVEENVLKLSITEGGKEGTHQVTASCSYLEEKLQECRKRQMEWVLRPA